jgi:hypothetical protein
MKSLPWEPPVRVRANFERFVHRLARTDAWMRPCPPTVKWDLYTVYFRPVEMPVDHQLVHLCIAAGALSADAPPNTQPRTPYCRAPVRRTP